MAAGLDQAESKRLLDASLGLVTYVAPTTPMKVGLYTVIGSAAATGTEVTGGSYARQSLAAGLPASSTAGSPSSITNSVAAITFANMPATTVVAVEFFDSNGTPRRHSYGGLAANKTTAAGDSLTFATSQLTATLG